MKYPLSARVAPSINLLMQIKDITKEDAINIRKAWQTIPNRKEAREAIDALINTCGIEYLGWHKRRKEHIYYCNAGDAYATTIVFSGLRATVQCWGDMVEKNLIEETQEF